MEGKKYDKKKNRVEQGIEEAFCAEALLCKQKMLEMN